MTKGTMPQIVPQGNGFNELSIEPEIFADCPSNLRDISDMKIAICHLFIDEIGKGKDLSLAVITPICAAIENTVSIDGKS